MRGFASLLVTLSVGFSGGHQPAFGASFRFVDQQGVVHFTNIPTDPRYQQHSGGSGTASDRLRFPENSPNRYGAEIGQAAERYGVDARLVEAVIGVESGFDPWTVSRRGARGLMQLMPQTAAALGIKNSFDPRQNIVGGVRHLRALLDRYGGDISLALAAYNAGPYVVEWYGGIPPYPETWQYVQRVLDRYLARASDGAAARPSLIIYHYEDAAGTAIYTNIPPRPSLWGSARPTRSGAR